MKKYLVAGLLAVTLMIGFAKKADATQQYCATVTVHCENGNSGYGLVCGSTTEEFIANAAEMAEVICSN